MLFPLRETPSGKLPDSMDHPYPPAPPEAFKDAEYATPTAPPGSPSLVITRAGGAIVILKLFETKAPAESVSLIVKGKAAARLGMPERLFPLKEMPSGKLPDSMDHEYGLVPPDAPSDAE